MCTFDRVPDALEAKSIFIRLFSFPVFSAFYPIKPNCGKEVNFNGKHILIPKQQKTFGTSSKIQKKNIPIF